jgi:hypothetical protein
VDCFTWNGSGQSIPLFYSCSTWNNLRGKESIDCDNSDLQLFHVEPSPDIPLQFSSPEAGVTGIVTSGSPQNVCSTWTVLARPPRSTCKMPSYKKHHQYATPPFEECYKHSSGEV